MTVRCSRITVNCGISYGRFVKVKVAVEQAMKAQRRSRGIVLLFP
jgi:hypothetical protein